LAEDFFGGITIDLLGAVALPGTRVEWPMGGPEGGRRGA